MLPHAQPFKLQIPERDVADLRARLALTRYPDQAPEKIYTKIRHWTVMPKGGHFAAMEQPELLASDVAEFFRPLRDP